MIQGATAPPEAVVEEALRHAVNYRTCYGHAPRAAITFNAMTGAICSIATNKAVLLCARTETCRLSCRERCVHAEARAIMSTPPELRELADLVYVKANTDGRLVESGPPSCAECAKLAVYFGMRGIWLYHGSAIKPTEVTVRLLNNTRVTIGSLALCPGDEGQVDAAHLDGFAPFHASGRHVARERVVEKGGVVLELRSPRPEDVTGWRRYEPKEFLDLTIENIDRALAASYTREVLPAAPNASGEIALKRDGIEIARLPMEQSEETLNFVARDARRRGR